MKSRLITMTSVMAVCLCSSGAFAETPRDVDDLVGARASSGASDLERRGFVHIKTQKGRDRSWSNWWNSSRKECLSIATAAGHYESISLTSPYDCNQSDSDDHASGAEIAVAVGLAALVGAVAAKHNSHHHEDNKHYDEDYNEEEFERGHRDGLYNHTYDNYEHTDAYASGYDSGVEQRSHDTSYRQHHGRTNSSYSRMVYYNDLEDSRAAGAQSSLTDRGFTNVDGFKEGHTSYTIWYNRSSGQCVQMTVADGRVQDLSDIGHHHGCR